MSFAWPQLLWLLLFPGALLLWDITHRRRIAQTARPKILRAEAGARSLKLSDFAAKPAQAGSSPRLWLWAGLAFCVVALARPQWGRLEEPVFDQSREILLAIDLSRSMLTPDVRPSRLDRGKLLIQSLLEKLAGERVGLVVFSGTSFLQSPLSADYEILREFLPALGPDFLPEGGSNYGAMLDASLQAFGASGSADRFLVILSDGEATDDNWKAKIPELSKKSIRVISLGVGTATGGMIPDGTGGLIKDERGAVVLSKLESGTLQELAKATNGVYRDASTWVDLAAVVNETIEQGRKGQFVEKNTVRLVERFQWPLAFGLWCLFVSFYYEFPVRPRPRQIALRGSAKNEQSAPGGETLSTVAAIALLAWLFFSPVPLRAAATRTPMHPAPAGAPAKPPEPPVLAKIVGRLSALDSPQARDWAELGRETVAWGSRLQSEQQAVPPGPVQDALAAVNIGQKQDSKVTDWKKLREELEALLKKPDEEQQQQQNQDQQDQKDQQQQDQQNQDQKSDQKKKQDPSSQPQSSQQDQKDSSEKSDPTEQNDAKQEKKPPGESAFGDMNKQEEPPPPPPQNMQKVGGAPEGEDEAQEPQDPALALPRQKLDQLRNQDSPAQLFQLMEGQRPPTKKTGKDW